MHVQVPQGFAAEEPKKYVLDDKEYERISKLAQLQLNDAKEDALESLEPENQTFNSQLVCADFRSHNEGETNEDDELKQYNLDTYDDDSAEAEEKEGTGRSLSYSSLRADFGIFTNVKGLAYYANNDEDPYITLKDVSTFK
jgi:periodic tryptophan protein 1